MRQNKLNDYQKYKTRGREYWRKFVKDKQTNSQYIETKRRFMENKVYRPEDIRRAVETGEFKLDNTIISVLLRGIPVSGVLILTFPPTEGLFGEIPNSAQYGLKHHGAVLPVA